MNDKPKIRNYNKKLKLIEDEEHIIHLNDSLMVKHKEKNIKNGQEEQEE